MKTYRQFAIILIVVATSFIHRNAMAAWTNVFVDDFSEFTAGTTLPVVTNYIPSICPVDGRAKIFTNAGYVGTAAIVTNIAGNNKLLFSMATNTSSLYGANLTTNAATAYSNIGTRISFDLMIGNTNYSWQQVGLYVSSTNWSSQNCLLGFGEGMVSIFTNFPASSTRVAIASVAPNTSYSYLIDWNLYLDTYSVFRDGISLTNDVPIPDWLSADMIRGFTLSFGNMSSGTYDYLLDNVVFAIPEPSPAMILGFSLAAVAFLRRRRA